MSRGWSGVGAQLARRVKELQVLDDAQLRTLPVSSRYLLAPALSVLANLYAWRESAKRFLYRHGVLSPAGLPSPVVSIGNLTNGGTGKTPFVEYLARSYLQTHRLPSLILQRGRGTVDETVMLRHLFEDLPIVVSESTERVNVAREYLLANPNVRLVLLDDGLQHLPLVRDLEIVMVNALQPLGNGHLYPRGTLLERPKAALRRADAVVLHHADLAGPERMDALQRQLSSLAPRHTLFMQTAMAPTSLRSLISSSNDMHGSLDQSVSTGMGVHVPLSTLHGAAVVCLVGIGHPQTVEAHLRRLGAVHIEGCGAYEDHHMFSLEDVQAAIERTRQLQAQTHRFKHACIVMTEKDYARQHNLFDAVFSQYSTESSRAVWREPAGAGAGETAGGAAAAAAGEVWREGAEPWGGSASSSGSSSDVAERSSAGGSSRGEGQGPGAAAAGAAPGGSSSGSGGREEPLAGVASEVLLEDACESHGSCGIPTWGAYVLQSGLQVVEHDRRFSSQNAVLSAMLRMAVDNFRRRSYISS